MLGNNKNKPKKVKIHWQKKHMQSPHVLFVQKQQNGFTLRQKRLPQSNPQTTAQNQKFSYDHQFTSSPENQESIHAAHLFTQPNNALFDDEIVIENHIEDAYLPFLEAGAQKHAQINEQKFNKKVAYHTHGPGAHTRIIKTTIMFAVIALVVTAPLYTANIVAHAQYTTASLKAISSNIKEHLTTAGTQILDGDTTGASESLSQTEIEFAHAVHLLESFQRDTQLIANTIPPLRTKLTSAQGITQAGLSITQAINSLKNEVSNENDSYDIKAIAQAIQTANEHLQHAQVNIKSVKPSALPAEIRSVFITLKNELNNLIPSLATASKTTNLLLEVLTKQPRQTILVVFQNNHEIRATGGFWGSFALVTTHNGNVESIEVPGGGTYDIKGQLDRNLRPPAPMQLIAKEWQFQDANWFPDFPESAQMATWFLEHAKYGTPDAIVAITPTVLEQILDMTGPIEMPAYNQTLTRENVIAELQSEVELEYDKEENKPKKIIGDLAHVLFEKINTLNPSQKIALLSMVHDSLNTKDVIVFHQDDELQHHLAQSGWAGTINKNWDQDYLMVINHNIAGQKTDKKIMQDIIKQTTIHENGSITTDLTIRRTHTGQKGEIFSGVRNVNYLRVLVPKGAELLSATGFTYPDESLFKVPEVTQTHNLLSEIETSKSIHTASGTHITTEADKTAFGNWTMTDPGETSIIKLSYTLPFNINEGSNKSKDFLTALSDASATSYALLIQKQPGAQNTSFTSTIHTPKNWNVIKTTDTDTDLVETTNLETDQVFGIVLTQSSN